MPAHGLLKKIILWIQRKTFRNSQEAGRRLHLAEVLDSRDENPQAEACATSGRGSPIGDHPDFSELLVLSIVTVILGEHFAELFGELVGLVRGIWLVIAGLVISDAEPRAAAV